MTTAPFIAEGQTLVGPQFAEPMRVETVRRTGPGAWEAGLVGTRSERFRRVTLTAEDIAGLAIADAARSYQGDGRLLRLALQAHALGIAYEFDPYFGLSISRVDPLPHQLEAVYEHLLKLPTVRFLLADDAGAGKTIMAGLLVRELKLRGLVERVLVACPANLAFQWQRELKEKFDEQFLVLKGSDIRDQFGVNQWLEQKQVITSLDLAKREDILPGLKQAHWDRRHRRRSAPHVRRREAEEPSAGEREGRAPRQKNATLPLGRDAARQRRPSAAAHRHAAQGRRDQLHALPATAGSGRLRGREVHRTGDAAPPGALLPAPHQGGDGLLPEPGRRRAVGGEAGVHQAHPAHRRVPHRRRGVRALRQGDALREGSEPTRRGRRRQPTGAGGGLSDVALPAPPRVEHPRHAAFPREPRQALGGTG